MIAAYPPHPQGEAAPHPAAVWLDLLNSTEAETRLVEELCEIDLPTSAELSEIEQSSRLSFDKETLRLSAPMAARADTDELTLTHVGFVLTRERLITIHDEPLQIMQSTSAKLAAAHAEPTGAAVFVALMQAFVARQADLLEGARAKLDELSHRVFREQSKAPRQVRRSNSLMREKLRTLGRLGERTSIIRESLLAVDRFIPFALESAANWFDRELRAQLRVVREDIGSLSQFEEHLLGKIQFLLDAVLGLINVDQNEIFKVLTIASVVGIFPTLVVGWYGMNFHNMPEYGWTQGYQFGALIAVISTILPVLWFRWRGWL
jgi:magnesium transporter